MVFGKFKKTKEIFMDIFKIKGSSVVMVALKNGIMLSILAGTHSEVVTPIKVFGSIGDVSFTALKGQIHVENYHNWHFLIFCLVNQKLLVMWSSSILNGDTDPLRYDLSSYFPLSPLSMSPKEWFGGSNPYHKIYLSHISVSLILSPFWRGDMDKSS